MFNKYVERLEKVKVGKYGKELDKLNFKYEWRFVVILIIFDLERKVNNCNIVA